MRGPRGSPRDEERLDELEDAVDRLREVAESGTVLVEGARDVAALDWLGIGGLHLTLHRGKPLADLLEDLVHCPPPVVLLLDWDRTGGRLLDRLHQELQHRVQVDVACRRRIASACRSRTLEAVPSELTALRRAVHGGRPSTKRPL
jgi:5S rRNA maturation endonuclease (ribonuclease M5)